MPRDHHEGFERERVFQKILCESHREAPQLKSSSIKNIIRWVAPQFLEGLFTPRPCQRRLRYIGDESEGYSFFVPQKVYHSVDFTGATYSVEGYETPEGEPRRIGYEYFEWIDPPPEEQTAIPSTDIESTDGSLGS
jgi:hypothetical protein